MSNRRFAAVACVAAVAAFVGPAGLSSAGPAASGGTKVTPKNVGAMKSPSFRVGASGKSSVPAAKAAKSVKRSP